MISLHAVSHAVTYNLTHFIICVTFMLSTLNTGIRMQYMNTRAVVVHVVDQTREEKKSTGLSRSKAPLQIDRSPANWIICHCVQLRWT